MADINSNIRVNVDTSEALANIKALQRQISAFQVAMAKGGAAANAQAASMRQNLINTLNASGQFAASIQKISSTTETFTNALEKNKLSMGEYFRYAGGASKSFGRLFKSEMDTIEKVAVSRVKSLQTQYIKLGRDANGAMKAIAVRPLALDMESLATKTAIAAQKQQLLNQLLKQGSTNLLNFGKNTQWAGRQLMVGFTIPLTMLGSVATKTFMQMEEQAIKFKRVYGDSFTATAETDAMLKQIKQLSTEFTKYGVAVEKTMELAATAAASGKMGADLLGQVSSATRLAVLGNIDQQKALDTTISLTNAFGTATEELASKINFLNAVENQTVTSIDDLTTAIPKAAPVIKQLGGDVEDLAFFLTAMREGGVNASEGANALKSGLASLINPTGKASKMLEGFGINIQNIVQRNKNDVKGLVIDFSKALNELDPLKRAQAIEQLFGKFQFSRLSTLFQNVTKEGTQASRVLQLTQQTSAELAALSRKELKSIEASPMFKFQKAIADFKNELAPVGEEFVKAVTPLINFGSDLLKAFNKLDPAVKQFVVNFTGIVAGLGPVLLMTFGLIANGVANLIKGFAFIKNVFNRASSASTVLGETTHYMTTEQVKAAAVAASLQQAHNKLTQAFTVETSALNTLTSAYMKATAEQAKFGATPGKPGPRKKYASGIVSVPGPKGAGDIVPAMLAPGEAVIPAKMASKYSGFIRGMISGNIPGFEDGTAGMNKPRRKESRVRNTASVEGIRNMLKSHLRSKPTGVYEKWMSSLGSSPWAGFEEEQVAALTAAKQKMVQMGMSEPEIQRRLNNLAGSDLSHIQKQTEKMKFNNEMLDVKQWRAKNLQLDARVFNQYAHALSSKGSEFFEGMDVAKIAKETGLSQEKVRKELQGLQSGAHPTKNGYAVMAAVGRQDGSYQGAAASAAYDVRKRSGAYFKAAESGILNPPESTDAIARQKIDAKIKKAEENVLKLQTTQTKQVEKNNKAKNDAAKKNTKATKKNTKVVEEDTKNKKRVITEEQRRQRAQKLVEKARAEIASGKRTSFTPAQARANSLLMYGSETPTTEQRQTRRDQARDAKEIRKQKAIERRARITERRGSIRQKISGRFSGSGAKASGLAMGGMLLGGMAGGKVGEIITTVSSVAFAASSLAQAFPKLAAMVARLIPVFGLIALAGSALYFTYDLATRKERERVKQAETRAEAVTITGEKRKSLADFFGKTLSQKYFVEKSGTKVSDQTVNAVKELRLDEAFKTQYATTVEALKAGTNEQIDVILKNLSLGLSSDFAPDEIAVIVEALKQEAGKTSVTFDFASIDVTTKTGRKAAEDLVKNAGAAASKFKSDFAYSDEAITDGIVRSQNAINRARKGLDNEYGASLEDLEKQLQTLPSKEIKAAVKEYASTTINAMTALRSAFDSGSISLSEFQTSIRNLSKDFSNQTLAAQILTINQMLENLKYSSDTRNLVQSLSNTSDQYLILAASVTKYAEAVDIANQIANIESGKSVLSPDRAESAIDRLRKALRDLIDASDDAAESLSATEEQYNSIGNEIDNLQTGLDIISQKEEDINKKYDERLEALRKVQEANDIIARQQQDQLDIAERITSGDVAGAARAVQQARQNNASSAFGMQENALESARQAEISALMDPKGRTRSQLEKLIKDKEMRQLLLKFWNPDEFKASGGHIRGKGTGTSDSIPAMLSNGEYVIRAKAVKALGVDTLNRMNHAEKFMSGGPVNIAKYAKGGMATSTGPNDIVGRGLGAVMDGIYQNLFGGWFNNVRKGKPTAPTLGDAGTIAMNALPIPGLKGAKGITKLFGPKVASKPIDFLSGEGASLSTKMLIKKDAIVSKTSKGLSALFGKSAKNTMSKSSEDFDWSSPGSSLVPDMLSGKTSLSFAEKIGMMATNSIKSLQSMVRPTRKIPQVKISPEIINPDLVAQALKNPGIFTRRSIDSVVRLLQENKTRTLFDTGKSAGSTDARMRSEIESALFGDENVGKMVYGYLADAKKIKSVKSNDYMNPFGDNTSAYGDVLIQLKKSVFGRTSITPGDSLNNWSIGNKTKLVDSIKNPKNVEKSFREYYEFKKSQITDGGVPWIPYLEAQMAGYTPRTDIARIHVLTKEHKKILDDVMKNLGIKIPVTVRGTKSNSGSFWQNMMQKNKKKDMGGEVDVYANGGLVNPKNPFDPISMLGRGLGSVMDGIYQNLFGGWGKNLRQGKLTAPSAEDLGTIALGVAPIPGLKSIKSATKSIGKSSPIIRGLFTKTGAGKGISTAGKVGSGYDTYFLKKLGSDAQKSTLAKQGGKGYYPEGLVSTGFQEYILSNVLRSSGMTVPDLKIFSDMSGAGNGLVLGSKWMPEMTAMDSFDTFMPRLLRDDPQKHLEVFKNLMGKGIEDFASRDAVASAIIGAEDRHFGNMMFSNKSPILSSIDFGRITAGQPRQTSTLYDLVREARQLTQRTQAKLLYGSGLTTNKQKLNYLAKSGVPHNIEEIEYVSGANRFVPEMGLRSADMKPTAMRMAQVLGFNLGLDKLPSNFASKNPIIVEAIKAMRSEGMDPGLIKELNVAAQQRMMESIFTNIKTIVGAKDTTFKFANGGMVKPSYFANGGLVGMYAKGGDVVPSMLTPGEFVVSQPAVKSFGVDNLKAINNGTHNSDSVYNYSVNLNVNGSNASAEDIARAVSKQIERVNSQRIRGTRV